MARLRPNFRDYFAPVGRVSGRLIRATWSGVRAPAMALVAFLWPSAEEPSRSELISQLDGHCRAMLKTGEELAVGVVGDEP